MTPEEIAEIVLPDATVSAQDTRTLAAAYLRQRATLADMTQQRNRWRAESKRLRDQLKIPVDKPTGQA